ncbi:UNVERIFIED_CONTAM: hypothetical protein RMT77_019573 [Armadillidium vulgare]
MNLSTSIIILTCLLIILLHYRVTPVSDECPIFTTPALCFDNLKDLCKNDAECGNGTLCCHNGCVLACLDPYIGLITTESDEQVWE